MEKIYISKSQAIKWGVWGLVVVVGILWWLFKPEMQEELWTEESKLISAEGKPLENVIEEEQMAQSESLGASTEDSEIVQELLLVGVHVTGAVEVPDQVVYLPEGSRVADAIASAGGAKKEADLSQLNLAAYIKDGQRIYVPCIGENIENIIDTQGENPENLLTNINLASKIELLDLPGIGETYAERIIQHREENGPFETIEDIMKVKGIGESKFNDLKDKITVNE